MTATLAPLARREGDAVEKQTARSPSATAKWSARRTIALVVVVCAAFWALAIGLVVSLVSLL